MYRHIFLVQIDFYTGNIGLYRFVGRFYFNQIVSCVFKILQQVVGRHFRQVAYHTRGQHILHLCHHFVRTKIHDTFLAIRNDFELTAVYHDEIIHRAEIFHADFMGLLVVELPFGSNLLIEYIEIFHLGEIAFDGLYGLRLLCQAAFKLCLLRHLFHALGMDRGY